MDIELLKNAMKRRQGKGIDIRLIIEGPQGQQELEGEEEKEKMLDLAPEVKDNPEHMDEAQDKELIKKELEQMPLLKKMAMRKK